MTLQDSRDRSFYSGDQTGRVPAANDSDLTSRVSYDGRQASTTNTGSRYLRDVSVVDTSDTARTTSDNGRPCEWITTKFSANKNGVYEVTIHDGNIYIKNEDGQERLTTPQQHHPASRDEYDRRDSNYYRRSSQNDRYPQDDDSFRPRPEAYYRPEQPQFEYPPREQYNYPPRYHHEQGGLSAGGFIIGAALGALFGGRRHGFQGGYDPYQNFNQVGYVQSGFRPVQNFNDDSYYRPRPRYYGTPRIAQYDVNPQYTSGNYPGTYYNNDGYDS